MRHPLAHSVLIVLLSALPFRAEKAPPLAAAQIELSFAPIVKTTAPGVVNIYASRIVAQHASLFAADPFYPANYGNALLDMAEELVGINTSILTRSGGSDGIGFAIPANLVGQYIDQARAGHTSFHSPWAGIAVQQVEASIAQAIGEMAPRGVANPRAHSQKPGLTAVT